MSREAGPSGKERKERGMRKVAMDEKQGRIVLDKEKGGKKVIFRDVRKVEKDDMVEMMEVLRKELKKEIEVLNERWKETIGKLEERLVDVEEYITELKEEKMMGVDEPKIEGSVGDRNEGGISVAIGKKSRYRGSSRGGLVWSGLNEGLSEREVYRVRKMERE